MDSEYVTIPKDTLDKILDNGINNKEQDAKIMIENSKTNRYALCVGLLVIGAILVAWILTPGDVQVKNTSRSVSEVIK